MALTKCKECGAEISTKAITCPKCGAKVPERTSFVTWLVLIFIIFVTYSILSSPTPTKSDSSETVSRGNTSEAGSAATVSEVKETPSQPEPAWHTSSSTDEMTGESRYFAFSPSVKPARSMSFPYSDVSGRLAVGCDSDSEWVYAIFDSAPNLANDETKDGYSLVRTRIKWDEELERVELTQNWGARSLHFSNAEYVIRQILTAREALFELQWHGEQPVYFKFSLNGSTKALQEIRGKCNANDAA